jgi:hypothetical protein
LAIFVFVRTAFPREWALVLLSAFIRDNRQLSTAIGDSPLAGERGHFPHRSANFGIPVASERLDRTQEVGGSNPPSSIASKSLQGGISSFRGRFEPPRFFLAY